MTMGAVPWWHAARRPNAIAVVHGEDALTWGELARRAARKARALQTFGVRHNDRVSIVLPNGNAFFEAVYATWMLGATPNPLNPRAPAQELQAILELAQPAAIIGADLQLLAASTVLPHDWADRGDCDAPLPEQAADCWKLIASGGSTGRPKLILSRAPARVDPDLYDLFDPYPHDGRLGRTNGIMANPGPLYHNGPFAISLINMLAGSTIVGLTRFDSEETLRQIEQRRVELIYLVPTMMHRISKLPRSLRERYDLSSLRGVLHTAAPCPAWLKEQWIDWLGPERMWETYGSTEAIANTIISGTEWLEHRGSVGRFYRGQGRVLDADGHALPPGEIGELWFLPVSGPGTTYEYIGAERHPREGWESIGDLGSMDAEGYLYLADRRSDLILRGGVNIYPAEIEAVIASHPEVVSCAVIGLPDEDLGERIHAIVNVQSGSPVAMVTAELMAFLNERLSRYKLPASIEIVAENLRDDAGKLRRSALRAERIGERG
jgi:bile acid-coenzyme A ligase